MLSSFRWYRRLRGGRWSRVTGFMYGKRWVQVDDNCREACDEDWRPEPVCDHSHSFVVDLPPETNWYSSGNRKGPHGPGLQIMGCYKCGKVWCRDFAA